MSKIQVLPTHYQGITYRSRLESRYAMYFDLLRVEHEYEPECFLLKKQYKYTPDFYLPKYNLYVEVKPNNEAWNDIYHKSRWHDFSKLGNFNLIIFEGYPGAKNSNLFVGDQNEVIESQAVFCPNTEYEPLFYFPGVKVGEYFDISREINYASKLVANHRFYN